jgi:hypothetical protein
MRLLIFLILLIACNPVKQVLKDPEKFEKVKDAVIRSGACINDTITVENTKDSVIYKDSIVEKTLNVPCPDFEKNLPDGTVIKISSGVLTYQHNCKEKEVIRTTTKTNNIRDRALENILKGDIQKRDSAIAAYVKLYSQTQEELRSAKKENTKLKLKFWAIILAAGAIIFRKQIFKIARVFI